MFDVGSLGKVLIAAGAVLVVAGIICVLGVKIPWLGRLPGDIYIQKKSFTFIFPLTTCVVASIIISVIMFLLRRR
jgi:uncharacterized protein HemY